MRQPFLPPALALAGGIVLGKFFRPDCAFLFLLIVFLLPFLWYSRGRKPFRPLFFAALAVLGMLRIASAQQILPGHAAHFVRAPQDSWVSLEGRVTTLPESRVRGKRISHSFVVEADNLFAEGNLFEVRGKVQIFLFHFAKAPLHGSRIRVRGRLEHPKKVLNPGEFNYREYLARQGIHVLLQAYGKKSLTLLEGPSSFFPLPRLIQKARERLASRLDRLFSEPENILLKALLLGMRKDLPVELRDDFVKTGTAHLIAISGMNITLVAGSLFLAALLFHLPQKTAAIAGLAMTWTYVFLSGAGIPVLRAGWMASLFFLSLILEREKNFVNSLFFAFFMILAADPQAIFQVGFQLSFLSVLSMQIFQARFGNRGGELAQTASILLGTFPLGVHYFNLFSWASIFANLLAVPLFHLGSLGSLLALAADMLPGAGKFPAALASFFLGKGMDWIHFWAGQEWGFTHLPGPSLFLIGAYYGSLTLLLLSLQLKKSYGKVLKIFSFSFWLVSLALFFIPQNDRFALNVLSLGNNQLIHVQFPGQNSWLINAGRGAPGDQARWSVIPYLRSAGVNRISGIFLNDLSKKRTGGLKPLLNNFKISSVLYSSGAGKKSQAISSFPFSRGVEKVVLSSRDRVVVSETGSFQIVKAEEDKLLILIEFRNFRFLVMPSISENLLQTLAHSQSLSGIDVLIFPAEKGKEKLYSQAISLCRPRWAVAAGRIPEFDPPVASLLSTDSGAVRFQAQKGGLVLI